MACETLLAECLLEDCVPERRYSRLRMNTSFTCLQFLRTNSFVIIKTLTSSTRGPFRSPQISRYWTFFCSALVLPNGTHVVDETPVLSLTVEIKMTNQSNFTTVRQVKIWMQFSLAHRGRLTPTLGTITTLNSGAWSEKILVYPLEKILVWLLIFHGLDLTLGNRTFQGYRDS